MAPLKKSIKAARSPRIRKRAAPGSGPGAATPSGSGSAPRPSRHGSTEATSTALKVCVRIRPNSRAEEESSRRPAVKRVDSRMLIFDPKEEDEPFFYQGVQQPGRNYLRRPNKHLQFMFDKVFGQEASNVDVFDGSTKDLIDSLMEGYNCSVFVYGATGAGKTFTMLGYPECPGITYLTMSELFDRIDLHRDQREFDICVSYLEIYNENVHDLLQPSGSLHLREDGKYGVHVAGLYSKNISTAQQLLDMLDKGNKNRTQHPTDANAESSRSHAVFQVYVKMRTKATNQVKIVKLSMIDLAGSERASATGCKGDRFKEGANINRSLLALGNCINQLADGSKFIPYRDSKLTRLLKDSLGGNCRTVMIANVAPTTTSYEDTYNTLKYACRANKIQQKTKKNIINCDDHVAQYVRQIEELKDRVLQLETELLKAREKETQYSPIVYAGNKENYSEELYIQWVTKLKTKAEMHFSNMREVLQKQRKQRGLTARAIQKRRAAATLAALCSDTLDTQLKEIYCRDVARLNLSSNTLIRQAELLQNNLKEIVVQLQSSDLEFVSLQKEAVSECPLLEGFLSGLNHEQKFIISQEKEEHLTNIATSLQNEMINLNSFVKNSLSLLKKYYLRLKSQGIFTTAMAEEYNDHIREAKSAKAVTWEDEQENVDCDDICFKYIKDIDLRNVSNIPQIVEDVATVPSDEVVTKSLNEDDVIMLTDSIDDLNATYTEPNERYDLILHDNNENRSPPTLNTDESNFTPSSKINPGFLNSTFVLTQKNEILSASKKSFKTTGFKTVLSERTNVPLGEKLSIQKQKLPLGKVAPFKRTITPLVSTKENKSGFGSSSGRFQSLAPSSNNLQVGCKAIRTKERAALASTGLPYRRPPIAPMMKR